MSEERNPEALERALADLGRVAVPVEDSGQAARRRDRMVGALGSSLGRVRARRRTVRRGWVAFVSALSIGAAVAMFGALSKTGASGARQDPLSPFEARAIVGSVLVRGIDARSHRPARGESLRGGEMLETEARSSVELALPAGNVLVESESRVEVARPSPEERRLHLTAGAVDIDLPSKLPRGQELVVETPHAEIRVIGTAFRVDLGAGGAGSLTTHVKVRRGTVWVLQRGEQKVVLGPGERWQSQRAVAVENAPVPSAEALAGKAESSVRRAPPRLEGTLAEENRLFEAGLSARNAGDDRRAADTFAALLLRYPHSVLAEQSLAERFRALDRAGQVSLAVAAARRYLAGYPQGFAKSDAERIAGGAAVAR